MKRRSFCILLSVLTVIIAAGCKGDKAQISSSGTTSTKNTSSQDNTVSTDISSADSQPAESSKNDASSSGNNFSENVSIPNSANTSISIPNKNNSSSKDEYVGNPVIDAKKDEIKKGKYTFVWSDEFDGNSVNMDNWDFLEGGNTAGDTRLLHDKERIEVSDGTVKMRATKYFDPTNPDIKYAEPHMLSSYSKMNFRYGYLEMRAKVPYQKSAWPAFWLMTGNLLPLPENRQYNPEVDIFEVFSHPFQNEVTLHKHYIDNSGTYSKVLGHHTFDNYLNLSNEFHLFGFEWTPEKMIFSVDGKNFCETDITDKGNFDRSDKNTDMSGFHEPMYIILNVALCTPQRNWVPEGSTVDFTTQFPILYEIDWIRLYQDKSVSNTAFVKK